MTSMRRETTRIGFTALLISILILPVFSQPSAQFEIGQSTVNPDYFLEGQVGYKYNLSKVFKGETYGSFREWMNGVGPFEQVYTINQKILVNRFYIHYQNYGAYTDPANIILYEAKEMPAWWFGQKNLFSMGISQYPVLKSAYFGFELGRFIDNRGMYFSKFTINYTTKYNWCKNFEFNIFGDVTTMVLHSKLRFIDFSPVENIYSLGAKISYKNLFIQFQHMCAHPSMGENFKGNYLLSGNYEVSMWGISPYWWRGEQESISLGIIY